MPLNRWMVPPACRMFPLKYSCVKIDFFSYYGKMTNISLYDFMMACCFPNTNVLKGFAQCPDNILLRFKYMAFPLHCWNHIKKCSFVAPSWSFLIWKRILFSALLFPLTTVLLYCGMLFNPYATKHTKTGSCL